MAGRTGRHWATAGRRAGLLLAPALCAALAGCANFWDDVTSRDFHFKDLFKKAPDPLWVIENSTDNDRRGKALASLREPLQHGGTQEQQDRAVAVLTRAALSDPQPLCRLNAIDALSHYKDPRAVEALKEAYYRAGSTTNPDAKHVLTCRALAALGEVNQPAAVEVLVSALRAPPREGADGDLQKTLDERAAAARALGHYPQYQAAEALVAVLRDEHDPGLRKRATASLRDITGRDFPADTQVWSDFLHQSAGSPDKALAGRPGVMDQFIKLVSNEGDN